MNSKKFHKIVLSTIPKNSNILYLHCGTGGILNKLKPNYGVGVDSGKGIVEVAKKKYPPLNFYSNLSQIRGDKKFDFIILDEVLPQIGDVFYTLKRLRELCKEDGKLITTTPKINLMCNMSNLFKKKSSRLKNWVPKQLLNTLFYLSNFWPRKEIDSCIIADAVEGKTKKKLSYSIIIPAYNEQDNIAKCIERVSIKDRDYEIIVANDGSKDRTSDIVKELIKKNSKLKLVDYEKNQGKGYATKKGLDAATKDIVMILDADMTVKPEDLPSFMEPFESKNAEFVNGTRMVYPLANQAMRPLHILGNKIFSMIFSYLLNQNVTDTLCGTKCMFRKDYQRVKMQDVAWPDFDLLFGASKLNLKIVEIPIHYQNRVAGESKMKTFNHGMMLLKASLKGFVELKLKM